MCNIDKLEGLYPVKVGWDNTCAQLLDETDTGSRWSQMERMRGVNKHGKDERRKWR